MTAPQTMLQLLQTRTIVDCDTMDVEVVKALGPFVDCTSNQAIAYFELLKPQHKLLIRESAELAVQIAPEYPDVPPNQLAVEIAMVKLQLEISKHVTGRVHIQTNPYFSHSLVRTTYAARRIIEIFRRLDPSFNTRRVCIKIPSTWAGLQACRHLEFSGNATLATTLFTMTQVQLAGEVGCTYIAPYVNELKVHFEPGFVDHNKAQALCVQAQAYYTTCEQRTLVLPASLTSTEEIMVLAGVHHITIAPALLLELATTPAGSLVTKSLFDVEAPGPAAKPRFFGTQAGDMEYRMAFTREDGGEGERKLAQAINIFCDMQDKLEAMMDEVLNDI